MTKLKRWREEAGLSPGEVADLTGVSTSMLSLVERLKRQLSPLAKVTVARRLGVSVATLFDVEPIAEPAPA